MKTPEFSRPAMSGRTAGLLLLAGTMMVAVVFSVFSYNAAHSTLLERDPVFTVECPEKTYTVSGKRLIVADQSIVVYGDMYLSKAVGVFPASCRAFQQPQIRT